MEILIIPYTKFFSDKKENKNIKHEKESFKRKNCCHYFLLYILYNIYTAFIIVANTVKAKNSEADEVFKSPHTSGLYSVESIEAIFITIVSIIILKNRYFIHNIISLIFIIILSFIIDITLGNFDFKGKNGYVYIILYYFILYILFNY